MAAPAVDLKELWEKGMNLLIALMHEVYREEYSLELADAWDEFEDAMYELEEVLNENLDV